MAGVLFRTCRAGLQGNIFSRREVDYRDVLFGYLRHGLIGRGVMLFGVILLLLNFVDGLYKLSKLNWHIAYQTLMAILYVALSIRLIQLILAFRGGE
jgi:hypothetical protein